jgi:hypothetical protein
LIVAILHPCALVFWEAKVAKAPILSFDIWTAPPMGALIIVIFLSLMSFGIFIWYFIVWNLTIRGDSLLASAARIQPLTVSGTFAALLAAWLIPRLPAQYILTVGSGSILLANLLLAAMPAHQIYWRAQFSAVILSAFSPDLIFTHLTHLTHQRMEA